jgi:hypothetical protein
MGQRTNRQRWAEHGKCVSLDKEKVDPLFFIGTGGSTVRGKEFCHGCPVIKACLHYAILYKEKGIWGGSNDRDREEMYPIVIDRLIDEAIQSGTLEDRDYGSELLLPAGPLKELDEFLEPDPVVLSNLAQILEIEDSLENLDDLVYIQDSYVVPSPRLPLPTEVNIYTLVGIPGPSLYPRL